MRPLAAVTWNHGAGVGWRAGRCGGVQAEMFNGALLDGEKTLTLGLEEARHEGKRLVMTACSKAGDLLKSIANRVDSVRVSIPQRVDSVMTTDSPAEADEQTPPATVTRAGRTVRYWSYETKRRIVEATMQPGASVSVVARQHDVNANLLFFWRKLFRQGRLGRSEGEQRFVQVGVVGSRSGLPALTLGAAGLIELELPGGIRLRMDSRIEEAALQRVLRAVKSCA